MRLSVPIYQLKRRAKLLARAEKVPLHEAQDRIARKEGFRAWSALSACMTANSPASALLPKLADGDMLLLGARPGQGKTLLGIQLLLDAARDGRRADHGGNADRGECACARRAVATIAAPPTHRALSLF